MLRTVTLCLLFTCQLFVSSIAQAAYFYPEPTATDAADGSYTIAWKKAGRDVGRFKLYETPPNGSRSQVYYGTGLSKSFSGKANGSYKYEVYALRNDFSNPYEPDIRWMRTDTLTLVVNKIVTPPIMSKPAAPSTDSDRKIYVSWSASTGNGITQYQLYVNKSGSSTWGQAYIGSGRAYTYTAPSDGTYNFKVRAYNTVGWGGFSSTDSTITSARPGTPTSISAPSIDYDGSVYVSWGASSGSVDKYQLYQQTNDGAWALVYDSTGRSRTSTLADGKYKFKVRACNNESSFVNCTAYKESTYSYVVKTPGVPSSISGVPSSTTSKSVTVSWGASSGTIKRYELQQSYNGGTYYNIYTSTGRSKSASLGLGTYQYRVRACNEVLGTTACSGYRTSNIMAVTLPSPLSFSVVASTSPIGTIKLNWSGVVEATSYTLQESKNSGSWVTVSSSLTHTVFSAPGEPIEYFGSYNRTGRTAGTYKYRLKACKGSACSAWRTSSAASVVFPPTKPSSITVPTSIVTNGIIAISWAASSTATYYKLQEKKNSGSWYALTNSTASLSYSRTGRTDANYTYRVTACNTAGCDTNWRTSTAVSVILPPILPAFSASPSTTTRGNVLLSWGNFSTVLDADTYTVQQSKDGGTWTTVSTTLTHGVYGGNNGEPIEYSGSYTVTGLANGSYQYRLKACKSTTVCTGWRNSSSVTVLLPPSAPASIIVPTATVTNGTIAVSWAASSTATKYQLQESTNNGATWTTLTSTTTSTSYSRTGRGNGSYKYQIRAYNASGWSGYRASGVVTVLLPPPTPASITVPTATVTNGTIAISWAASSTATKYQLQESVNGGAWTTLTSTSTSTSYSRTGRGNGSYKYQVRSYNTSGWSGYRASGTVTVLLPPPTPSGITVPATTVTNGTIGISWVSSSTATKYQLQESVNSSAWTTLTSTATSTNYSRSGRRNSRYKYQVRAYNNSGWSGYRISSIVNVQNVKSKQIIFIHTDLLGTPVTETDENGDVQ